MSSKKPKINGGSSSTPPTSPQLIAKKLREEKLSAKNRSVYGAIRHWLLQRVAEGTPFIKKLQSFRNPVLDAFFIVSSFLGDKILYVYALPWFFWYTEPQLGRMSLMLLIFGTIIGNLLKNALALPRPPSPPLWSYHRLEDFGMVSSHSLNSVTMPFFFLFYLWPNIKTESSQMFWTGLCVFYTISMFFSRMYLAAHSPADVVSGGLLGVPILYFWTQNYQQIDDYLRMNKYAPLVITVLSFLLLVIHPRSSRPSPSWKYSISLSGIAVGMTLGSWGMLNWDSTFISEYFTKCSLNIAEKVLPLVEPQFQQIAVGFVAIHIGLVLLITLTLTAKFGSFLILGLVFDFYGISSFVKFIGTNFLKLAIPHPPALDNLDHPTGQNNAKVHDIPKRDAKMVAEFISTMTVGWSITYFIPLALHCWNLIPESLLTK